MRTLARLLLILAVIPAAVQMAYSRGDKVIPQVVDGPGWTTHFDLINLSPDRPIRNMRVSFYKNDGSRWNLQTNQGTGTDFPLNIGSRQTQRFSTLGGGSSVTGGYAVIRDEEPENSEFSDDYTLGISAFYVASSPSGVTDTVTVSVPRLTAAAAVPVQMDASRGIYSGIVILNWAGTANRITIDLYPENYVSGPPQSTELTLQPGQQRAEFLDERLFPGLNSFKGMAEIRAEGPIAFLGLLQTRAHNGDQQYSTLVPVDRESLRRNSYIVLLQANVNDETPYMPLDVDSFVVDYFRTAEDPEDWSWDILYSHNEGDVTQRFIEPLNGAGIASIGILDDNAFDTFSLPQLKGLTYTTNGQIDLGGVNLSKGYTFAIRTDRQLRQGENHSYC